MSTNVKIIKCDCSCGFVILSRLGEGEIDELSDRRVPHFSPQMKKKIRKIRGKDSKKEVKR